MGKNKCKSGKKGKRKKADRTETLHPEAACAFKTIQSHRAINGKATDPRSLDNGGFAIDCKMDVTLPSRAGKKGVTATGIGAQEPIRIHFPLTYPFRAPTILLRQDFNRSLPHINPILGFQRQDLITPCIYDGSLDDLMHQTGDGLSDILDQLSQWLDKAAIDNLIDPAQGWEPTRRDDSFGWIVYDLSELRPHILDKAGALTFPCLCLSLIDYDAPFSFISGIDCQQPHGVSSFLVKKIFFSENWHGLSFFGSIMIIAWPDSKRIAGQYMPESVHNLRELYDKAKEYGCGESLKSMFVNVGLAIKNAALQQSVFHIPVILCARRPFRVIGDDDSIELIPYMAACHVDDKKTPISGAAVKFREDSPVYPLGHRHALTGKLLRQMSGGLDILEKGTIVHIGCGSVGSKIAMHLARAGHGPFKLIDKSNLSPHNAARHALVPFPEMPVQPKALLLANQINLLRAEAEPENIDLVEVSHQKNNIRNIIPADTRLAIETTGSIAVRELLAHLSPEKFPGRILHAALYQAGESGLMMLEGQGRNPNLSDLSVQFYDLMIDNQDLREKFRDSSGTMNRQNVGLGCGSHTMVMPDTRISLYTAGMAERARQVLDDDTSEKGEIWIGVLESNGLQISWQQFETGRTKTVTVKTKNNWEIRILENAFNQIEKEAKEYGGVETGGVLIGKIFVTRRCIAISRAIQAPTDSQRSEHFFLLGTEGLDSKIKTIHDGSNGNLNYVGTWHTHPKEGKASLSDKTVLEQLNRVRSGSPVVGLIRTPSGYKAILDEGKLS